MPTHKWRQRPPRPCANIACGVIHSRHGKYCSKCQKRLDRHGAFELPVKDTHGACSTPACNTIAVSNDHCDRCDRLWLRGINPDTMHRPYRRLCKLGWCWRYAHTNELCQIHHQHLRDHGHVRRTSAGIESFPNHCTWPEECADPICARGLCLEHLTIKAKEYILFRCYLPELVGHPDRKCSGKPRCKGIAILFRRCADCLYDWQFSLTPKRNFFKIGT